MKLVLFIVFNIIFNYNYVYSKNNNLDLHKQISKNIRCIVCQGQSIDESNSDFAINIKNLISAKLEEGLNEEEIYQFLKSRYGEWIVYKPELNINNFILWILPYALFIAGGFYIFTKLIKKKKKININRY
ncbi:MAG: cytochrome c-type biogenesis protein CcmH [Candidatus Pelagibacterales bacterium]|nr:cytochrome c-type biogenesis protein CcmH [Candidatus Pelagibacter sp.]RZO63066.1 MAG: cytochrome c-type biogenesis protein CcmH [Pelagibacterales bacterium]